MTAQGRYSRLLFSGFTACVAVLGGDRGSACPPPPAYFGCPALIDVPCVTHDEWQIADVSGFLSLMTQSLASGGNWPGAEARGEMSFSPGPSLGSHAILGVNAEVRYYVCVYANPTAPPSITVVPVVATTHSWGRIEGGGTGGAGSGWLIVEGPGAGFGLGVGYNDTGQHAAVVSGTAQLEIPVGGYIEIALTIHGQIIQDASDLFGTGVSSMEAEVDPDVEIDPNWEFKDYFALEFSENLVPHGDLDRDGDLDLYDLAEFTRCFSGTEAQTLPGCAAADFDGDGTVGLDHFAELARTLSGPISFSHREGR